MKNKMNLVKSLQLLKLEELPQSEKELDEAYRSVARTVHPDRNGGETGLFIEATQAYDYLVRLSTRNSTKTDSQMPNYFGIDNLNTVSAKKISNDMICKLSDQITENLKVENKYALTRASFRPFPTSKPRSSRLAPLGVGGNTYINDPLRKRSVNVSILSDKPDPLTEQINDRFNNYKEVPLEKIPEYMSGREKELSRRLTEEEQDFLKKQELSKKKEIKRRIRTEEKYVQRQQELLMRLN